MYKIILMYADQYSGFERRLEVAAALAQQHRAHLIGTAASGGAQLDYQKNPEFQTSPSMS